MYKRRVFKVGQSKLLASVFDDLCDLDLVIIGQHGEELEHGAGSGSSQIEHATIEHASSASTYVVLNLEFQHSSSIEECIPG